MSRRIEHSLRTGNKTMGDNIDSMTNNRANSFFIKLLTIIQRLPILSSSEFNKYNRYRIKRVRDFREYIFRDELNKIDELLSNLSTDKLSVLEELISDFDRIRSEIRYVSKSLFKNDFINIIEEVLNSHDKNYALIIRDTYEIFNSKLSVVKECKKDISASDLSGATYLGLFTASFIVSLIHSLLKGTIEADEARRIVSVFEYDFLISYIFVSTRSHIVFEINVRRTSPNHVRKLLNSLLDLFDKPEELRRRYIDARSRLSEEKYPFDLKYPVIRHRRFFNNEWISLIIIAFRRGDRRTLLKIDPNRGFETETYFPASSLYFEIAVSEKKDKLLIMTNTSPNHRRIERVAKFIFLEILGIDIGSISYSKYLESLNPIRYEISSVTVVEKLRHVLEGSPSRIVKKLKSFESRLRKDLDNALENLPLTYKDKLRSLVSTLKLAGIRLEYKLGEHTILSISSELSPFIERSHITANPEEVYSFVARLIRTKTEIHKHIENLVENQDRVKGIVSLVFTCKLNQEKPAEIIITDKGNILFFNINREIITELSRLFQEVVEKWSKKR